MNISQLKQGKTFYDLLTMGRLVSERSIYRAQNFIESSLLDCRTNLIYEVGSREKYPAESERRWGHGGYKARQMTQ